MRILLLALIAFPLIATRHSAAAEKPRVPKPKSAAYLSLPVQLQQFIETKEEQLQELSAAKKLPVADEIWEFFDLLRDADWKEIDRAFQELRRGAGQYRGSTSEKGIAGLTWSITMECYGAVEEFTVGDPTYSAAFAQDVIASIPPGSVYFGGTDPGRFLITAFSKSHAKGDPFFTLTRNALADGTYLDYLRSMYGEKLSLPTTDDSNKAFNDYITDAGKRFDHDAAHPKEPKQLRPGEEVRKTDGRIQVSGQTAVMAINGNLVKSIVDRNPTRSVYLEQSTPLDWTYPHLEPNGLIFKLNHAPAAKLSNEVIERDQAYWKSRLDRMIGKWLTPATSIETLARFAKTVHGTGDLSEFQGDPKFIRNEYARRLYAKLRGSIAELYAWRAEHASDPSDKSRMAQAAELAFKQAFALDPGSQEAVLGYVRLLQQRDSRADALLLVNAALSVKPATSAFTALSETLRPSPKN